MIKKAASVGQVLSVNRAESSALESLTEGYISVLACKCNERRVLPYKVSTDFIAPDYQVPFAKSFESEHSHSGNTATPQFGKDKSFMKFFGNSLQLLVRDGAAYFHRTILPQASLVKRMILALGVLVLAGCAASPGRLPSRLLQSRAGP